MRVGLKLRPTGLILGYPKQALYLAITALGVAAYRACLPSFWNPPVDPFER